LIVGGDARVRRGIRSIVESFPSLELVGESNDALAAFELIADRLTTVAIVDLEPFAPGDGLQIVGHLTQKGCSVVAMSSRIGLGAGALAAGAVAFVEKDERGAGGLIDALRKAAAENYGS
jgi:DNA-binding NarL/FixJ family response regulator